MLIGLQRKFVFIANLKSASSAVEKILRPLSEIALVESRFGKHLPFHRIEERFAWVFKLIPPNEFMIFGIIRDPIEYTISLFNSHTDIKFQNDPRLYTGEMDFDMFLGKWCTVNADQIRPQFTRFIGKDGTIAANLIISFPKISEGLDVVASRIDAPDLRSLPIVNASNARFSPDDLSDNQRTWICEHFERDRRFIAQFCDRVLTPEEQSSCTWTQ